MVHRATVRACVFAAAAIIARGPGTATAAAAPADCERLPPGEDPRRCFTVAVRAADKATSARLCAATGGRLPRLDTVAVGETLLPLVTGTDEFIDLPEKEQHVAAFADGTTSDASSIEDKQSWHFDNGTVIPEAVWCTNQPRILHASETCAAVRVTKLAACLGSNSCNGAVDYLICEYNTDEPWTPALTSPATSGVSTEATTGERSGAQSTGTSGSAGGSTSSRTHAGNTTATVGGGGDPAHDDQSTTIAIAVGTSLGVVVLLLAVGGTVTCVCVQRRAAKNRNNGTPSTRQ